MFSRHKKIDYISYPYEWGFYQLKSAALFHLDFQLYLLNKNVKLIDSSAYNIQFINHKPVFIDVLSLEKYQKENTGWGLSIFTTIFKSTLIKINKRNTF